MKKLLQKCLAVVMALALFNVQSFAMSIPLNGMDYSDEASEVIDFNEDQIYSEFVEIEEVTTIVANEEVTYEELSANADLSMIATSAMIPGPSDGVAPPLGIGGFWWGCLLGPLGLILVYFLTGMDPDHTRSALWGCIISTLISGGGLLFTY